MDYFIRLWRRATLPLEAFKEPKALNKEEAIALAGLINRKEFRIFEKYLVWKIRVQNAEAMRSESDQVTHDRKIAVNILKEIPYDLRSIWLSAQPKKPEGNEEQREFRIFNSQ